MSKNDVEKYVLSNYPLYLEILSNLENGLNKGLDWYYENHPELCKKRDFRPGTIARFMSCSTIARFQLEQTLNFIKNEKWEEIFLEKYAFSQLKEARRVDQFKDIDQSIRFNLFHSFYHQLETTIRMLVDMLELQNEKGKPLNRVNTVVNCFPEDFILCIDALRNTIHNNGYYRPLGKNPQPVSYINDPLSISFKPNDRTAIGTLETIQLVHEMSMYLECLLKSDKIIEIDHTNDRN